MYRTHPLYFIGAIAIAVTLQYLLVRRINRAMEAKHGEATVYSHHDKDKQ